MKLDTTKPDLPPIISKVPFGDFVGGRVQQQQIAFEYWLRGMVDETTQSQPQKPPEGASLDLDSDSRGSSSSLEGDTMSSQQVEQQQQDQGDFSNILMPASQIPSGVEFTPAFKKSGAAAPPPLSSFFDTPPSMLQSPNSQQQQQQQQQNHQNETFSPNGSFLRGSVSCVGSLMTPTTFSPHIFLSPTQFSNGGMSTPLDTSMMSTRSVATPHPSDGRSFSFSLNGLPVSPAIQGHPRMSTSASNGMSNTQIDALSSPWSTLAPPPLALKNISNLNPGSPMIPSNFDLLGTNDDAPVFSPLSPTNTSNMIPHQISSNESTPPKQASVIAPPRSSVSSTTTNRLPSTPQAFPAMIPTMMLPPVVQPPPPPPPTQHPPMGLQPPQSLTIESNNPFLGGAQCQGCESNPSFAFCLQCNETLCNHCVQAHQRVRATKLHRVVSLNQLFAQIIQQQAQLQSPSLTMNDEVVRGQRRSNACTAGSICSQGDGQPSFGESESYSGESSPRSLSTCGFHDSRIVGYCDNCPHPLCAVCLVQHSSKHRVQPIGDLRLAIGELVNENCMLEWQCEKTGESIQRIIEGVIGNAQAAEKDVKTTLDVHISALEERKRELLKRVETVKSLKLAVLYSQAENLKNRQSKLKRATKTASEALEVTDCDEGQLRQVFETLAACQLAGNVDESVEMNNNLINVLMLACQVNEDDRLKFSPPQDGTLLNKIRQFGNIESGACAKNSTIIGDNYKKAIRERQAINYVQLRDGCGDLLSSSIPATQPNSVALLPHQVINTHFDKAGPTADVQAVVLSPDGVAIDCSLTPRENGIVAISYFPFSEGVYTLNVLVKGTPITGCPASIDVRRGRNYEEIAAKGPIFSFGNEGSGDGELCRPWGICVDVRGRVLVADRSNNRVQVFDKDGKFLSKFGTGGNRPGQFDRPAGITTNTKNHIVVADKDNHRVQVFDENGTFILKFGDRGRAIGYFNYPWGVATNSHNAIAVSDTRNHRVQIFTEQGQFVRKCGFDSAYFFKNLDSPRGLCYLPDGQLMITDFNNHRLAVLSPRNMSEMKVYGSEGDADGMFVRPQGVKIDPEGHILVCDSRNNRIQVFDSSDMRFIASFGINPTPPAGFQMPTELAIPYSSLNGPFGAPTFTTNTPTPMTPTAGAGTSPTTSTSSSAQNPPSNQFILDRPTDVAIGQDGRIYVVDFGNNCIRVF